MIKLAFTGRFLTGKDSRADELQKIYPDMLRLSFAMAVKQEVAKRHNVSVLDVERNKQQYREELQEVGHQGNLEGKWVRIIEMILLDAEEYKTTSGKDIAPAMVITDVRYPDEVDMLRYYGFTIIRLEAPREVLEERHKARYGTPIDDARWNHVSEAQIDTLDVDRVWDATENPMIQVKSFVTVESFRQLKGQVGNFITTLKGMGK